MIFEAPTDSQLAYIRDLCDKQGYREAGEWLRSLRGYLLACIGDAEGTVAVEKNRMLRLTAGQVQVLAEALGLVDAALASARTPLASPKNEGVDTATQPNELLGGKQGLPSVGVDHL